MSKSIKTLIQEKFGYTVDLPSNSGLHDKADNATGDKKPQPSAHPLEEFRNVIKALMGATTTEEDGILEDAIDFEALQRLANKHAFAPEMINQFNTIALEIKKPKKNRDNDLINKTWENVRESIPYWFIGMLPPKKGEELPDLDKKNITNLLKVMEKINAASEKAGKENAKDTEHASRKTEAKKNLDSAKKEAGIKEKEAGSEKKLDKGSEIEVKETKIKSDEPKLEEDPSKKETPKDFRKEKVEDKK